MKFFFFTGHRETFTEILPELTEAVEQHITKYGVTEFIVGCYSGFDRMAARAVIEAKRRHPVVNLSMLIPYHPAERPIEVPPGFDNTFYPPGMEKVLRQLAILRANRYMVDHTDYLIAYVWHPASDAKDLVEYAKKREAKLIKVTLLSKTTLNQQVESARKHCMLPGTFYTEKLVCSDLLYNAKEIIIDQKGGIPCRTQKTITMTSGASYLPGSPSV